MASTSCIGKLPEEKTCFKKMLYEKLSLRRNHVVSIIKDITQQTGNKEEENLLR
jgi:hypothetical protein